MEVSVKAGGQAATFEQPKAKPADRSWALARLASCPERGGESN